MFELIPFSHKHNLSSYDPFRDFLDFGNDFFRNTKMTDFRTDIKDVGSAYQIEADLPGFNKEDIDIDINDKYLTISAERHYENEEKDNNGNYIRRERSFGSFSRSFDTEGIDTEKISASYNNGVLKLDLPKIVKQSSSSRHLEIN